MYKLAKVAFTQDAKLFWLEPWPDPIHLCINILLFIMQIRIIALAIILLYLTVVSVLRNATKGKHLAMKQNEGKYSKETHCQPQAT